jgi:hypothetical protein
MGEPPVPGTPLSVAGDAQGQPGASEVPNLQVGGGLLDDLLHELVGQALFHWDTTGTPEMLAEAREIVSQQM